MTRPAYNAGPIAGPDFRADDHIDGNTEELLKLPFGPYENEAWPDFYAKLTVRNPRLELADKLHWIGECIERAA